MRNYYIWQPEFKLTFVDARLYVAQELLRRNQVIHQTGHSAGAQSRRPLLDYLRKIIFGLLKGFSGHFDLIAGILLVLRWDMLVDKRGNGLLRLSVKNHFTQLVFPRVWVERSVETHVASTDGAIYFVHDGYMESKHVLDVEPLCCVQLQILLGWF